MPYVVTALRHGKKNENVARYVQGASGEENHRGRQETVATQRGSRAPREEMNRNQVEIQILRRILFAIDRNHLVMLRSQFETQPELFGEDQEVIDYIDWLIKRQEML